MVKQHPVKSLPPGLLASRFVPYFDEIEECRYAGANWVLLHVLVSLPDICAALQSTRGNSGAKLYINWCDRYLSNPSLSGEERYLIRGLVMHRGRTANVRSGRYLGFTFRGPSSEPRLNRPRADDVLLTLDIGELADEMRGGIDRWIAELEANPTGQSATNVYRNLATLVQVEHSADFATATSPRQPLQRQQRG